MEKVQVLCHSSIKITGENVIYCDPFRIKDELHDADYILCTHSHYDHFSPEDIEKVKNKDTMLIVVEELKDEALKLVDKDHLLLVGPNEEYILDNLKVKTTYAYNQNKAFHPKEKRWVGYLLMTKERTYYIAGDTDNIPEIKEIEADVAMIPIGGTFTMDYKEAAELANLLKAKKIIPIHYGEIVGEKEDAKRFAVLVKGKEVEIQI